MPFTPRPYQLDAVQRVRQHIRAGRRRVLCVAPTGAGKTVVASHITECSVDLGNRVLFLAHRRELISQAFRKMIGCTCRAGYEHDSLTEQDPECRGDGLPRKMVGVLRSSDRRRNPAAAVQVASIDTLRNRALPPANLIIVDEAHRSLANTYRQIMAAYPEAAVIGLTATPYRADGKGLGDAYDELVVVASPSQLMAEGFLVEPRIFTVPASKMPDLSGVRTRGGDYDEDELAEAVDRDGLVGDILDHWARRAEGRQTVVFAVNVQHSKHIVERFRAAGIAAEHVDGTTPTVDRDAILARLERGETRVVSNCAVLTEGWDMPSVKCAILARPTKSTGMYLQQAGRILRPWRGVGAIILDHAGCAVDHGLPQDDREFTLEPAKKRSRTTVATSAKTCEGCFAVLPLATRVCPECGHVFVVADTPAEQLEEKPGELVEVKKASKDEKRAFWDATCAAAIAKGYKKGWAWYRYRDKFGVNPQTSFAFPEVEREPATDDEKRAYAEQLREQQQAAGYQLGWIYQRYRAKFGEELPAEFIAPRLPTLARAVGAPDPEPAAAIGLEDWGV